MKPHVICHMVASVDGRIHASRWRPKFDGGGLFERLHEEIGGDAWLVGRVTGQEFSKRREAYPAYTGQSFPREPWFTRRDAAAYGVVLDGAGKIAWGRSEIGGDPIVVVLTRQIGDSHLAGLRGEGVSYIFAGDKEVDLALTLEILNRELGVKRLLVEGGGAANGAFFRAGLIDEISVAIVPAIDGGKGAPSVFDASGGDVGAAPRVRRMSLTQSQALENGAVWLRYRLEND